MDTAANGSSRTELLEQRLKALLQIIAAVLVFVLSTGGDVMHGSAPHVPSNSWAPAGDLRAARAGATVSLLYDGYVLVAGGTDDTGVMASTERYSPDGNAFIGASAMETARANHSATLLPDGKVLVAGGVGASGTALASAELYDPANNVWQTVAPMHVARSGHTATALYDGRVVIAGGDDAGNSITTIEIYDPWSETFELVTTPMSAPRTGHAAALTYEGRVVIAGGFDGAQLLSSIDVFDPYSETIIAGPSLSSARAGLSATTLLDGTILLLGGAGVSSELATAELYDPTTSVVSAIAGTMTRARQRHQAVLLPHNNQVLIVGGTNGGNAVGQAEVYVPWQGLGGSFFATNAPAAGRAWATATALSYNAGLTRRSGPNDGLMLLGGGSASVNASGPSKTSELYGFATLRTDQADYSPGTRVTITGSGWVPGEPVTLTLIENPLLGADVLQPVTADGAGNITSTEFVPDKDDVGIRFYLTASGSQSEAQTSFTDALDGSGTMIATPSSVAAGNSGNTYSFTFTNSTAAAFNALSQVTLEIPAGWTPPQNTTPTGPGFVTVSGCSSSIASVTAGVIAVDQTCGPGESFALRYGDRTLGGGGVVAPSTSGAYTFNATSRDGASGAASLAVNPVVNVFGAAAKLAFVQQPSSTPVGASIGPSVTVEVQDANGLRVTTSNVAIGMAFGSNPGGATLGGGGSTPAVNGLAAFSSLSVSAAGIGYTVVASSSGLSPATSNPFDVVAAAGSCSWVGGTIGDWNETLPQRWNCGGVNRVPTITDVVTINTDGVVVTIPATVAAQAYQLNVGTMGTNTAVTLRLAAASSSLTVHDRLWVNAPSGSNIRSIEVNSGTLRTFYLQMNPGAANASNPTRVTKMVVTDGTANAQVLQFEGPALSSPLQAQIDLTGGPATLNLGELLVVNGVASIAGGLTSTVNFKSAISSLVAGNLGIGVSAIVYNNLSFNSTIITPSLNAAITPVNVTGNVMVGDGINAVQLANNARSITLAANKSFSVRNGSTFRLTGTTTIPTVSGSGTLEFGATSTVNYAGVSPNTQTIGAANYGHLTSSSSGARILQNGGTIGIAGIFSDGSNAYTVTGSTVDFNGVNQTIPALSAGYNNLTLTGGTKTLTANTTVGPSGVLTLASTIVNTGATTLIVSSSSNSAVVTSGGGRVNGKLQKAFAPGAGQSFTFPIADTAANGPRSAALTNLIVTAGGNVTASTTASDAIVTGNPGSGINAAKDINRSWTLTPVGGLTISSYDATFIYSPLADLDGGVNTANLVLRKLSSGIWSAPPGGTTLATGTIAGAGFTAFSDFAAGELLPTTLVITSVSPANYGSAFAVTVQSQDPSGNPTNVTASTGFSLSVATGTGSLAGGTNSGSITAGTNSVVISGVTYSKAENGVVVRATRTSGNTLTAGDSAQFDVSPKTVTPTVSAPDKTYDGDMTAVVTCSLAGVLAGDAGNVTCAAGSATFDTKHVGPGKTVTASDLTLNGSASANYTLSSTTAIASAAITEKPLTVSATGVNKPYDGTTAATVTLSDDRVAGDAFTVGYTSADFSDQYVGAGKTVSVNGISLNGADAMDYSFNITAETTADITEKALTVSATGVNKQYDGNPTAAVTLSDDHVPGDSVTVSYASASFADKNVAPGKTVSVAGISLSGGDAANYTLANTTATTTADITLLDLTVSATGINKVYDGTTTATGNLSTDKLAGDTVTPSYTSAVFASSNVAAGIAVLVNGIAIAGGDAVNYKLLSTTAATNADITQASQAIAFGALANKTQTNPAFSVNATGGLSGNPVTFTTTTVAVCTSGGLNGSLITLLATGTCTVRASQPGNTNYAAAPPVEQGFTVSAGLTWTGFYQPVDMTPGYVNVVKGGSTVPLKFNVSLAGVEKTDATKLVLSVAAATCAGAVGDGVDLETAGGTNLRYEGHQFILNWKTPKVAGACYLVKVTMIGDGSSLSSIFKMK